MKPETDKVIQYGVYCSAVLKEDPKALPHYIYGSKEAAENSLPEADIECASGGQHFVKVFRP